MKVIFRKAGTPVTTLDVESETSVHQILQRWEVATGEVSAGLQVFDGSTKLSASDLVCSDTTLLLVEKVDGGC